jgi:large subunit ribosomal protein L19
MKQCSVIQEIEKEQMKSSLPAFRIGDTLAVHMRIIEGEKERIQIFTGTVVGRKGGGIGETVSLYRFSYGAGIERIFNLHSPRIAKIEIMKSGKVRKAKLYYLHGVSGKASKVKEHIGRSRQRAEEAAASSTEEPAT